MNARQLWHAAAKASRRAPLSRTQFGSFGRRQLQRWLRQHARVRHVLSRRLFGTRLCALLSTVRKLVNAFAHVQDSRRGRKRARAAQLAAEAVTGLLRGPARRSAPRVPRRCASRHWEPNTPCSLAPDTFGGLFVLRAHAAHNDSGEFRVACRKAAHMRSRCGLSRVTWCSRPSRGRSERGFGVAGVTGTLRVSVNSTAAAVGRTVVALARRC